MEPIVGVIMGSESDQEIMWHATYHLERLGIPCEMRVVSAHRTPDLLFAYASDAKDRGLKAIIAGAGGAAHLPGMTAALTRLPVIGVPMESHALKGLDSMLSMSQMPSGVPVATMAIGKAGAVNAALFVASILALNDPVIDKNLEKFRNEQTVAVLKKSVTYTTKNLTSDPCVISSKGANT